MSNIVIKDSESAFDVLAELNGAFLDIPFENSNFQNETFVIAEQLTPARAYRAIGLRMFAKIRAIKEYKLGCEEREIDIDEINYKLSKETDEFEIRRLNLKKKRLSDNIEWSEKLLNDAIKELNCLYSQFKKYPTYTRDQFEAEEEEHFLLLLDKQASVTNDSIRSLLTIQKDKPSLLVKLDKLAIENK